MRGFRYASGHDIAAIAHDLAGGGTIIASDLTLGSWRGHWVGLEFSRQLGIAPPSDSRPVPGTVTDPIQTANSAVARLIDIETEGDRSVLAAHAAASAVADAAVAQSVKACLVLGPSTARDWMREDIWLLRFLARDDRLDVAIAVPERAEAPALDVVWAEMPKIEAPTPRSVPCRDVAVPGLCPPQAGAAPHVPAIPMLGGWALLLPEARDSQVPEADTDPWLAAYRQMRLPARDRNVPIVVAGASQCFAEGGFRQAVTLLDSLKDGALDAETQARVEARAQSMRIACLDFAAAAESPDPDPALPDDLRRDLSATKAWGLVMSGQPDRADALFAQARALSQPSAQDPLWLYLMNISALAKFRTGQIDEAFTFEHEIEQALSTYERPDWHLQYINSINLARLHRASKQLTQSVSYYRKAFQINQGLRSDSDQIYLNVCQAGLEEAQGADMRALLAWLRAALHWLAMPVPEALAPRVARAMSGVEDDPVSSVSAYLQAKIARLVAGMDGPIAKIAGDGPTNAPRFQRPAGVGLTGAVAVGGPGWGVMISPAGPGAARTDQRTLARTVAGLMSCLAPGAPSFANTVITVDGCFGTELPTSKADLFSAALRLRCDDMLYDGDRISLGADIVHAALRAGTVSPGQGIDQLFRDGGSLIVTFRRSRPTMRLDGEDARLLECALGGASIEDIVRALDIPPEDVIARARGLEPGGLLRVQTDMPHDLSTAVQA